MDYRKKTFLVIVSCLCIFTGGLIVHELLKYFECLRVITFLEETKGYISSGEPEDAYVKIIDSEIQKIRKTYTYAFPIISAATIVRANEKENIFWIRVDWVQKKASPRRFKEMQVRFEHQGDKQELSFKVPPSCIEDEYEEKLYSDAFYMGFVSDPNNVEEGFSVFLPYTYSDGQVYISMIDNEGRPTDWLKCETVNYSNSSEAEQSPSVVRGVSNE